VRRILLVGTMAGVWCVASGPVSTELHQAETRSSEDIAIINGENDLEVWKGLPNYWYERDHILGGQQSEYEAKHTFLIYPYVLHNFKFRVQYRFLSDQGNSGIQFRSKITDPQAFRVSGYQADMDANGGFDGSIYDEAGAAGGRGTLSARGARTVWNSSNEKHETAFADPAELGKYIRIRDWNEIELIACNDFVRYNINGHTMTEFIDESPHSLREGVLALQLHEGLAMHVQFRNGLLWHLNRCE
jgi:hypothetical protein